MSFTYTLPSLDVAVMYNYYDFVSKEETNPCSGVPPTILLQPTVLTEGQFRNLFYPANGDAFSPNIAIFQDPAMSLVSQTFLDENQQERAFDLQTFLVTRYCSDHSIGRNSLPPQIKILLQRECNEITSLAFIKGHCISLSWSDVVANYVDKRFIVVDGGGGGGEGGGGENVSVDLPLQIVVHFRSNVLNNYECCIVFQFMVICAGYSVFNLSM